MSEESQLLIAADSGTQTVIPPLATPSQQVVYLDFDGAETSYNGEILTIDDIVVEDSGFDSETITLIVAALNEQFGDDIVFTADLPQTDEYSTIYVGVTSAFEAYGSFFGLAETIDSGNQIHDDNAFVMLNSTASLDLVTSVIAHETEHIVNGMEHEGEGLDRYKLGAIIIDGVDWGQTVSNAIIQSGMKMQVRASGIAINTTVWGWGSMVVSSGGTALNIVEDGGYINIENGAYATFARHAFSNWIMSNNATATVHSGTTATSITVKDWANLYVYEGGIASNILLTGTSGSNGIVNIFSGGKVYNLSHFSGGFLEVYNSGYLSGYYNGGYTSGNSQLIYAKGQYINIHPGATVLDIYTSAGCGINLSILKGDGTVVSGHDKIYGDFYVSNGFANNITISGNVPWAFFDFDGSYSAFRPACITVGSGCVASKTNILLDGAIIVEQFGSAVDTLISGFANTIGGSNELFALGNRIHGTVLSTTLAYGALGILSGGTALDTLIKNGALHILSGGVASNTEIISTGCVLVSNGGKAEDTYVSMGSMIISSGGRANITNIGSDGTLLVSSGALIENITNIAFGGMLTLQSGAILKGNVNLGGSAVVSGTVNASSATVIFDISQRRSWGGRKNYIINDLSLLNGLKDCVITIDLTTLIADSYYLAQGAAGFNKTITLKNTQGTSLGTLSVNTVLAVGSREFMLQKDNEGNLALSVSNDDPVAPVISSVSLAQGSNNYTFTATVTASDNVTPTESLAYQIRYAATSAGVSTATATSGKSFTLTASDAAKTYYYQVGVSDAAGNTAWSDAQSFTVKDMTAPTISSASLSQGASNYMFTATVLATDNVTPLSLSYKIRYATTSAGLSSATANSGKSFTVNATDATKTYYWQVGVTDAAGNTAWSSPQNITVNDVTPPTITNIGANITTPTSGNVIVSATFSDNVAVKSKQYRIGDGSWQTYTSGATVTSNATVSFLAIDSAGNSATASYNVTNINTPGPNPPTAQANITTLTNQNVTVTATFSSDTATKQYSLDNKTWNTYTQGIVMSGNGTVYFRGINAAGRVSDVTSYNVTNIDKVAPTISSASLSQGASNYTFTATVTASDNVTTNLANYKIRYATTSAGLSSATAVSGKNFTVNASDATKTYYWQVGVTDEAGNTAWSSNQNTITVKDVTAPTLNGTPSATVNGQSAMISWNAASDNVAVTGYRVKVGSNTYTTTATSYTVSNLAAGTYAYQLQAYDAAGNTTAYTSSKTFTISPVPDNPPVISSASIAQGTNNYTFTVSVTATDDVTPVANLTYKVRYATTSAGLNSATEYNGKSFTVNVSDATKTYYWQVGVTDAAGNTAWSSNQNTITVKDVTSPTLNGTPTASVNGQSATISWNAATDNVAVTGYRIKIGDRTYTTTATSYVTSNLAAGTYTYQLQAYDKAGNTTDYTVEKTFTIDPVPPTPNDYSIFQWSGTEYAIVQMPNVTKSNFTLQTASSGERYQMWRNDAIIIDAEKDSQTIDNAYLYMNTCWAATTANIFVKSGWADGIFSTEDDVLKYVTQTFSLVKYNNGYKGVGGGATAFGLEWLFNGRYDYWDTTYSSWSSPKDANSGGFYKTVTASTLGNYLSAEDTLFQNGRLLYFRKYDLGTGMFSSSTVANSYSLLNNAMTHLKNGDCVGLSVSWHSGSNLYERTGGHAITVYGFTYDESKKGTAGYFTGIIVADSDDDFLNGNYIKNTPATSAPNRIKVLPIEYNAGKGVYVFTDYGQYGVVNGFQYLAKRPANITYSLSSNVVFSTNDDWNAAYSVGTSSDAALNGTRGRITSADNVHIALNVTNAGLGDSDELVFTVVVDGDESNARTFTVAKTLGYGESDAQTVLNIGKLARGSHDIAVTVASGEATNELTISQLHVTFAAQSQSGLDTFIDNGQTASNLQIADGQTLTVEANGTANNTVVSQNGLLIAYGKADGTTVRAGGMLMADQGSDVTDTVIEANGAMTVEHGGHATDVDVHGKLTVNNGLAEGNTVYANGVMQVMNTGVASNTTVEDLGRQVVASGGQATGNSFSGAQSEQHVRKSGLASGNTFDGALQVVSDGGVAEDNVFSNNGVQEVSDGAVARHTELSGNSFQYISNAVAYDTVVHVGCMAFAFEGGLAVDCTVGSGGYLVVGDMGGSYAQGVGAARGMTIERGGLARLEEGAVLSGDNVVAGTLEVTGAATGAPMGQNDTAPSLTFDFSTRSTADSYMVNDISLLDGLNYSLTLNVTQAVGNYKFTSKGGAAFMDAVMVYDAEGVYYGSLNTWSEVVFGDRIVKLQSSGTGLNINVAANPLSAFELPEELVATDGNVCSWGHIAKTAGYVVQFSRDNFQTFVTVELTEEAVTLNGLPYNLQWRVRAADATVWTNGGTVAANAQVGSTVISGMKDWQYDVLFASPNEKWDYTYAAKHLGELDGWGGTGEHVQLNGKNKLDNVFEASSDANILLLTDDAGGDALFIDDIFSTFPDGLEAQARVAKIDEIRAGAGDDLVDLTSQRFDYAGGGMTVRGGLGNDPIWAGKGENMLFGDAGNDRIVGASGNDVMAGGAGDDSLHGGGGNDIFAFGGAWGHDTVEQLEDGGVTLWFDKGSLDKWNASTMTYTDGANSVKVSGVTANAVSLKFGDDGSSQYDKLLAEGAFDAFTSERIFENKNTRGMLA